MSDKRRGLCSGSFDPVTLGHIDIFERGARLFDELIVCVFHNVKKKSFLPVEERVRLLTEALRHVSNIKVMAFSGLVTDFMRQEDIHFILRGLRSETDLEYETPAERLNHHLGDRVETVFLLTDPRFAHISSSAVRELISFGADVGGLVPPCVAEVLESLNKRELSSSAGD